MKTTTIGLILSYKDIKLNSMNKEEKLKLVGQALLDLTKDVIEMLPDDLEMSGDDMQASTEEAINRCFRTILPLLDLEEKPSRREMIATTLMACRRVNQDFAYSAEQTAKWSVQDADALLKALAEGEVSNG